MKKSKFIFICIVLIIVLSALMYFNYDTLTRYVTNKEWQIVDSIASINLDKYTAILGNNEGVIIIDTNNIRMYLDSNKEIYNEEIALKSPVSDSCGKYFVTGEKQGNKIYLFCEKQKLWEFELVGEIVSISVNQNGYVSVIYMQSGYKSLVKTIKPTGEELFTNYLASTYAVDTCISDDNKLLAIAEVNTDGIKAESAVKIINTDQISEEKVNSVALGEGLVIDIEFGNKNELLIIQDDKTCVVDENLNKKEIENINYENTILASIENRNNIIIVKKNQNGLFDNNTTLYIYDTKGNKKEYILYSAPKQIYADNKTIAVDLGSEILFISTNGRLIKRCELEGEVKELRLYNNGNMAGLIFRDRIELVKI